MPQETWMTLKRINVVIRNSAPAEPVQDKNFLDIPAAGEEQPFEKLLGQMRQLMPDGAPDASITRLEQRLAAAEKQQDQLLYFIHFLYENFRDLVREAMLENERPPQPDTDSSVEKPVRTRKNPTITRRESEILAMLGQGMSVKEIAMDLFISENTVITHKRNLKEKFGARNTPDLVAKYLSMSSTKR